MFPSRKSPAIVLCSTLLIWGGQGAQALAGQQPRKKATAQPKKQAPPPVPASTASQEVPTEKIEPSPSLTAPPATVTSEAGSLRPGDVAALLKNVRFSEYRINDLLSDVKPERWKLPQSTLDSFNTTIKTLHSEMDALEQWRAQFNQRTDSIYLGFQAYAAIDAVLPRLYGVARDVRDHENASYAAQFNQAGDQLFDLQQTMGAYVGSLLRAQDQQILALDNNLAACQQSLGNAMRGQSQRAKPVRNSPPIRPQRLTSHHTSGSAASGKNKSTQKKPAPPAAQDQKK